MYNESLNQYYLRFQRLQTYQLIIREIYYDSCILMRLLRERIQIRVCSVLCLFRFVIVLSLCSVEDTTVSVFQLKVVSFVTIINTLLSLLRKF